MTDEETNSDEPQWVKMECPDCGYRTTQILRTSEEAKCPRCRDLKVPEMDVEERGPRRDLIHEDKEAFAEWEEEAQQWEEGGTEWEL